MILKKVIGIHLLQCMQLCQDYRGECRSFSYNKGTGECYLNSVKRKEVAKEYFEYGRGFIYYELV